VLYLYLYLVLQKVAVMIRAIFIIFTTLTIGSIFLTYQGVGLQEVESIKKKRSHAPSSVRSHSSSSSGSSSYNWSSGGYSYGK